MTAKEDKPEQLIRYRKQSHATGTWQFKRPGQLPVLINMNHSIIAERKFRIENTAADGDGEFGDCYNG